MITFLSKKMNKSFNVKDDVLEAVWEEVKKLANENNVCTSLVVNKILKDWLANEHPKLF